MPKQFYQNIADMRPGMTVPDPEWRYFGTTGGALSYRAFSKVTGSSPYNHKKHLYFVDSGWGGAWMGLTYMPPEAYIGAEQWEMYCRFKFISTITGYNKDICVGVLNPLNWRDGYMLQLGTVNALTMIRDYPGYADGVAGTSTISWTWAADTWYHARVGQIADRSIRCKLWKDSIVEPAWGATPDSNGTQIQNAGNPSTWFKTNFTFFIGNNYCDTNGFEVSDIGMSIGPIFAPTSQKDVIYPGNTIRMMEIEPGAVVVGGGGGGGGGSGIPSTYSGPMIQRIFRPGIQQ